MSLTWSEQLIQTTHETGQVPQMINVLRSHKEPSQP